VSPIAEGLSKTNYSLLRSVELVCCNFLAAAAVLVAAGGGGGGDVI
jgi:hypothetical protein